MERVDGSRVDLRSGWFLRCSASVDEHRVEWSGIPAEMTLFPRPNEVTMCAGFGGARLGRHVCGGGIGGVVDHLRRGADIGAGLGGTRLGVSKNGARSTPFW